MIEYCNHSNNELCEKCKSKNEAESTRLLLKELVVTILEEARSKHLTDCLHDDYLNDDFHIEVTLTVGEIKNAAKALGISDF